MSKLYEGVDLKTLSVYELAMRLNGIIKIKGSADYYKLTAGDLITLDTEWNDIVMELWERIPSLKDSSDIQPVLTNISEVCERIEQKK